MCECQSDSARVCYLFGHCVRFFSRLFRLFRRAVSLLPFSPVQEAPAACVSTAVSRVPLRAAARSQDIMAEKLEDLNLPLSVVSRIIKEALPDGVSVSKEARLGLAKVASVFVLYVTSASTNIAKKANRKTLTGQDVLEAMEDIEFDKFLESLREALDIYKDTVKQRKAAQKRLTNGATEDSGELIEEIDG